MTAFASNTWTEPVVEDWEAGDFVRVDKLTSQVFQNIAWLGTTHAHDGTTGGGATIAAADPKVLRVYSVNGGPFA